MFKPYDLHHLYYNKVLRLRLCRHLQLLHGSSGQNCWQYRDPFLDPYIPERDKKRCYAVSISCKFSSICWCFGWNGWNESAPWWLGKGRLAGLILISGFSSQVTGNAIGITQTTGMRTLVEYGLLYTLYYSIDNRQFCRLAHFVPLDIILRPVRVTT